MVSRTGDALMELMFWVFIGLVGLLGLWEFIESLCRGPAEQPAPRVNTSPDEPSEWEQLSEEDRQYLRWHFK